MKNIFMTPNSWLRGFFPFIQKLRYWAWKFNDRVAQRLVISGGKVKFMDQELVFPERVGLTYSTPLFWNGPHAYEDAVSKVISELLAKSTVFFDVGSNIGIYAVYAAVRHPSLKVVAFEPVPCIWEKNAAFHRANRLSTQNVLNMAVGDTDGRTKIFLPVCAAGLEEEQTATLCVDSWQNHEPVVETHDVECVSLDRFMESRDMPDGACFLKIDVENFEAAVLRGAKYLLVRQRPWMVCEMLPGQEVKTGRNDNQSALELLTELRYATFAITGDGLFRMTARDFEEKRTMKDFLLLPLEKISADISFLAFDSVKLL
jgi:FkbM family methyltransferase